MVEIRKLYYKTSEVASMFGVSAHTIRNWCEFYKIQEAKRVNNDRRFNEDQLTKLKWIAYMRYQKRISPQGILLEIAMKDWPTPSQLRDMIEGFNLDYIKNYRTIKRIANEKRSTGRMLRGTV